MEHKLEDWLPTISRSERTVHDLEKLSDMGNRVTFTFDERSLESVERLRAAGYPVLVLTRDERMNAMYSTDWRHPIRMPDKVEKSLGIDRRFYVKLPPDSSLTDLAKELPPIYEELSELIDAGWDVLLPPTVTTLADGIEYEAILTTEREIDAH